MTKRDSSLTSASRGVPAVNWLVPSRAKYTPVGSAMQSLIEAKRATSPATATAALGFGDPDVVAHHLGRWDAARVLGYGKVALAVERQVVRESNSEA